LNRPSRYILTVFLVLITTGGLLGWWLGIEFSRHATTLSEPSISTPTPKPPPRFADLDVPLAEGTFWEYRWSRLETKCVLDTGCSTESTSGVFRITLGSHRTIQHDTVYELLLSGDYGDRDFTPRWRYLGSADNRLFASGDGEHLITLFDAETGHWPGSGFFAVFDPRVIFTASTVTWNEHIRGPILAIEPLAAADSCELFEGVGQACASKDAYASRAVEYYREGVGPVGYSYVSGEVSDTASVPTSRHIEEHIVLAASSLSEGVALTIKPSSNASTPMGTPAADFRWAESMTAIVSFPMFEPKSMALTVCATDSPDRSDCDYVADGEDDQEQFNAAMQRCQSNGCKLDVREGRYSVSAPIKIRDNVELHFHRGALLALAQGANSNLIENADPFNGNHDIYIHGGRLEGAQADQAAFGDGIHLERVIHGRVENTVINDFSRCGVVVSGGSSYIDIVGVTGTANAYELVEFWNGVSKATIRNSFAYRNGQHGFLVNKNMYDILVTGNVSAENGTLHGGHGIAVHALQDGTIQRIKVADNTTLRNAWTGIHSDGWGGSVRFVVLRDNTASWNGIQGYAFENGVSDVLGYDNVADNNRGHGFWIEQGSSRLTLSGNKAVNNNQMMASGVSGFRVEGDTVPTDYVILSANDAYDIQAIPTQQFGIWESGNNTGNVISDNNVFGNFTRQILAQASTSVVNKKS
jgi:hypothetical protein